MVKSYNVRYSLKGARSIEQYKMVEVDTSYGLSIEQSVLIELSECHPEYKPEDITVHSWVIA
ncbi:hypothetical protein M2105_006047 [Paenibacillus sp. PastF-1]|nr:hypothetical protein [Paenibacillus sp. PastF-2]MDF9851562.1 hypothetical protein [Paenibacillus sp. PastM-2]MDF9858146.1 hypothetical protein [Paenibacillus sp. PastF-1]MDH6483372.1 hypothetical protein [Paenibacillus sp. PastH-2]MDH6510822.1 hypothetical protein [Paenibacillus sp. PastM-3]